MKMNIHFGIYFGKLRYLYCPHSSLPCTITTSTIYGHREALGHFFFQAEDGIRDRSPSRGLGDVYKRQKQDNFVPGMVHIAVRHSHRNGNNTKFSITVVVLVGKSAVLGSHRPI